MALPASGQISMSEVNIELGLTSTAQISLNDSSVRNLFGVASGLIDMNDGHGKANGFVFNATISSNTPNYNVKAAAIAAGWNQTSALNASITINSGIYVYSTSTATPAFATGSSFPAGTTISLTNNGLIVGRGGNGGNGGEGGSAGNAGTSGGPALQATQAVSINNIGTIGGGGGGGGGGRSGLDGPASGGGGGGGGGRGGSSGGNGGQSEAANFGSGSAFEDGRAGGAGTLGAAGGGGSGGYGESTGYGYGVGLNGGAGGGLGVAGTGGGGGAGGGQAGAAVTGNSNITWIATGTRLGAVS